MQRIPPLMDHRVTVDLDRTRCLPKVETDVARCARYRMRILQISRQVPAAHIAPAFSCLEIVDALYNGVMQREDIFIMSKGHGWLAQLVVLEDHGLVPRPMMDEFCQTGGKLAGHPDYWPQIGVHASTGSLGHGLGIGVGQAYAEKLHGSAARVFVLLSDGECQEGSTWEAVMTASNLGLDNLVAVVDRNDFAGMDRLSETHPYSVPSMLKFESFGWAAVATNHGNNPVRLRSVFDDALHRVRLDRRMVPTAIVADTVKGSGVSYMQDAPIWHYRSPDDAEYHQAMAEINEGLVDG